MTGIGIEADCFIRSPDKPWFRRRITGYPKFVTAPYPSYVHFQQADGGQYYRDMYSHERPVFVFIAARRTSFRNQIMDLITNVTDLSPHDYYKQYPEHTKLSSLWLGTPDRPGKHVNATVQWMRRSVFCLQPPGDSPTRKSIYDGILCGCIPVFFEWDHIPTVSYPFLVSYIATYSRLD